MAGAVDRGGAVRLVVRRIDTAELPDLLDRRRRRRCIHHVKAVVAYTLLP